LRREIPQKVDAQVSFSAQYASGSISRLGATLFRRTRSASVLSITLTATALGIIIPQAKAVAYFSESSTPVDTVPLFPESSALEQRSTRSKMLSPVSTDTDVEPLNISTEFTNWENSDLVAPSAKLNFSTTPNRFSSLEMSLPGKNPADVLDLPLETSVLPAKNLGAEPNLALGTAPATLSVAPVTPSEGKVQQSSAIVHTVEPGENLTEIAGQYAVSPETIAQTNRIQDPNAINVDESLVIPAINLSAAMIPFVLGSAAPQSKAISRSATQLGVAPSLLKPRKTARVMLPPSQPSLAQPAVAGLESGASGPMETPSSAVSDGSNLPSPQPMSEMTSAVPKTYQGSKVLIAKASVLPKFPPTLELPPLNSAEDFLPPSMNGLQKYIWPAQGAFTSGYGPRWGRMHRGIDIAAPVGTPVVASAPGVVVSAGWNDGGYGNLIEIRHPDGSLTRYAHNSRLVARKGEVVNQGELIAAMGSTGRSTGPHTHFEIHPGGRGAVDPMFFLSRK
jgi:murein DD-endopeptidase MepM/ murein hydrolase activator NlpD